ncbi:hypothetical protein [Streptomyces chiangmaiensis]|uniref:Secreted protein n=1 Tax=Streptomyces chiangmaiensis TaxID=766497 RepID=A0ABU7FCE5_9ACTN|nr:hypothetical protein [Streptomyces chiangmaiensis]MED7821584.1 hypothetical protein [Streptomyces chiangmaiensis]
MSARRWIIATWTGLCLAGLAATSALNGASFAGTLESPTGEPTPAGTYVVDCQEIADDIEQARAEAERERQQALNPSAAPAHPGRATVKVMAVPEECADELEDRGLKTR